MMFRKKQVVSDLLRKTETVKIKTTLALTCEVPPTQDFLG
jgi:hypothetical protein